jgi:hypothetical protein
MIWQRCRGSSFHTMRAVTREVLTCILPSMPWALNLSPCSSLHGRIARCIFHAQRYPVMLGLNNSPPGNSNQTDWKAFSSYQGFQVSGPPDAASCMALTMLSIFLSLIRAIVPSQECDTLIIAQSSGFVKSFRSEYA